MTESIMEIITILLRMIHPILLHQTNFQNKEEIKKPRSEMKIEIKKDGDFLFQSFKEAFPFLASKNKDKEEDPKNFIKGLLINPSQPWNEKVREINIFNIKNKTEMEKELALYEELLEDDWDIYNEEHTSPPETKSIHLLIEKH